MPRLALLFVGNDAELAGWHLLHPPGSNFSVVAVSVDLAASLPQARLFKQPLSRWNSSELWKSCCGMLTLWPRTTDAKRGYTVTESLPQHIDTIRHSSSAHYSP